MRLRVLLLEDDHLQRKDVQQALEKGLEAEVETKTTESEFHRDFEKIASNPPMWRCWTLCCDGQTPRATCRQRLRR
jgi:hypothetical protein